MLRSAAERTMDATKENVNKNFGSLMNAETWVLLFSFFSPPHE